MKIGLSTYSLHEAIQAGEMTVLDAIQWIAGNGGECVELSPSGYDFVEDPSLIDEVREKTAAVGIEIASYTFSAQFIQPSEAEYEAEIARVMKHVDIGSRLGVRRIRHDAGFRPPEEATIEQFEIDLPKMAGACRRVADHAARYGITTSVENHGYHVQHSDRVRRLIATVDRPNYRWTVDIGNFMCVDEDPLAAVQKAIGLASNVHFKDFYLRPSHLDPGEGWFPTAAGHHLRGAIVGHGDIDIRSILKVVKQSGYNDSISVEFEGLEDCRLGSRLGMETVRRLLAEC
jgi:sugar phosphate isomerase/epimerase